MGVAITPVNHTAPSVATCCVPITGLTMSPAQAAQAASIFKALADPARVQIVNLLANADGAVCVCDITPEVDLTQPTVSFHLKKLLAAGLVQREQRGKWAYYSLDIGTLAEVANAIDPKGTERD